MPGKTPYNLFEFPLGDGETITAATTPDNQLYFDLQELCWLIGLDAQEQIAIWQARPALQTRLVVLKRHDLTIWLARLDTVLCWLAEVSPAKTSLAASLTQLHFPLPANNSLDAALYAHFFNDHAWLFDWLPADNPVVEAYQIALAHLSMAREQLVIELLTQLSE